MAFSKFFRGKNWRRTEVSGEIEADKKPLLEKTLLIEKKINLV